ncbi:8380_t:CDS:2 [Gigaspora rosea]|nr:8380_t:CDS:2 [Gigaspora rosea]
MDLNEICNKEMIEPLSHISSLEVNLTTIEKPVLGSDLTGRLAEILPTNYSYIINEFHETDPLITDENIAISQIIKRSFYASLRSQTNATFNDNTVDQLKIQKSAIPKSTASTEAIISEKINNTEDTNNSEMPNRIEFLNNFFHEIESDIKQNEQLLSAFEKFQKGPVTIRSGTKIPVQVALVQRRKGAASHSTKRKASGRKPLGDQKNEDPHVMQSRKK